MGLLQGLDDIPWDKLRHAYGAASDVPALLLALTGADAEERRKTWWDLYGNLYHQGSIYEATAYAVPFLLELAQAPEVPDRHEILQYLLAISEGRSYREVHDGAYLFDSEEKRAEFWKESGSDLEHALAVYDAVRAGGAVYRGLLASPEARIRACAALLLGQSPPDALRNTGWLCAHFEGGEADASVLTACVLAMGALAANCPQGASWLEELLARDGRRAVRIAAAIGLAQAYRVEMPAGVIACLADALNDPGEAPGIFDSLPRDVLAKQCANALALGGSAAQCALPAMVNAMNRTEGWTAFDIAKAILLVAFYDHPLQDGAAFADLSAPQQVAMRAIAQNRASEEDRDRQLSAGEIMEEMRTSGLRTYMKGGVLTTFDAVMRAQGG
jgi:hypothetical protein